MFDNKSVGDPGWIRTIDLPLRRRPLYPLSYGANRVTLGPSCDETRGNSTTGNEKGRQVLAHYLPLGPSHPV